MRHCICINDNWNFIKKEEAPVKISLPHTWNNIDGQDGGNDYYRGSCTYQREITLQEIVRGAQDRVYLEFCGVNASAQVKVNGVVVRNHEGGYSTFRADITEQLKEENNLLEVRVDNSANDRVYPQRADFTFYGGIYRDVYLLVVPKSHFDLDYHGAPGIQVTTEMMEATAKITVIAYVAGECDGVRITVKERESGAVVGEAVATKAQSTNTNTNVYETVFELEQVHLWNGVKDPFLYEATAQLVDETEDQVLDEISTSFGCRTYSFDSEKGFFLNGESYPLHGVSRHQDRKDVGNALTKDMHKEDMDIILEMGANSIRLAHYQHDQYFYDLCDEKGIVVWAEIPYITLHMPSGRENTLSQMTELIAQNYNHPSIICWALSNEITLNGVTEDMLENHHLLNDLAHRMDPTRVTAMAHLFMLETDSPMVDIADIMSYNLYYGWYVGELVDNDAFFDEFHQKYPEKIIGLSEYGADALSKLQSTKPEKGDFSETYQCVYHEHMLEMFDKRPYLWSTYVWNMFEFAADAREDANEPGINHKGLVSFDRQVKKDAFYLYKAWWSEEAFVHLCGSRYKNRTEEVTKVKVYSNLSKVTLYKDGELFDEQEGSHVFTFKVPIEKEHVLEVRGGEGALYDKITICKVDRPDASYYLKGEPVKNWFDEPELEIKPGYFSIKDTLGDIKQVPAGKMMIEQMMLQMNTYSGDMAKDVVITDQIQQMMNRMTVEGLMKQAGELPVEMVVMVNKQLSQIKKPD